MTVLRALAAPLRVLVALAILGHDLILWAARPLWRWLAALRPLTLLAQWVATLPPGGVLLALAAPVAISEPLKLGGLYLLAIGQIKLGAISQVLGHGFSILLVERIVHAGLPQLLTYRWFAWGWRWYETIRDAVQLREFAAEGLVNIVGGCCGTTPQHIEAIRLSVEPLAPRGVKRDYFYKEAA